jgi:hypothetical protein
MSGSVSFKGKKNSKAPYIDPAGDDDLSPIADADGLYYVSKSSESDGNAKTSGQPGKKKGNKDNKDKKDAKKKDKKDAKTKDKEKAHMSGGEKQVRC